MNTFGIYAFGTLEEAEEAANNQQEFTEEAFSCLVVRDHCLYDQGLFDWVEASNDHYAAAFSAADVFREPYFSVEPIPGTQVVKVKLNGDGRLYLQDHASALSAASKAMDSSMDSYPVSALRSVGAPQEVLDFFEIGPLVFKSTLADSGTIDDLEITGSFAQCASDYSLPLTDIFSQDSSAVYVPTNTCAHLHY